jgi:hypothetical protein
MYAHCGHTLLCSIQLLPLLSLTLLLLTPIFQQLPIHILLSSTFTCYYWCSNVLFSFPSFPRFHRVVPLLQNILHLSLYMLVFMYMFIFISTFHLLEKMCFLCFWAWLTSLTRCHVAPIYLQATCHYSLWPSNTPLCMYTTFSWSILQLFGTWGVSKAWLLWIELWWTLGYRCLYCIPSHILLGRCPEQYHWIIWQFYL